MELFKFLIWEHATKYGMSKVLKCLKSSFLHSTVPNSWIASQLLDRIMDEWEIQGKITSKDVSAMQECLASMFKNYGTINLASAINVTDFIELDQTCTAAYVVLCCEENQNEHQSEKEKVAGPFFSDWNFAWNNLKKTYHLKDDKLKDSIKGVYESLKSEIRTNKDNVLRNTGELMRKHFPSLITYLQRVQPSTLEIIKTKPTPLIPELEFLPSILLGREIRNEIDVLNLCQELLMRATKKSTSVNDFCGPILPVSDPLTKSSIHVLPPKLQTGSDLKERCKTLYPPCFQRQPFMPSIIPIPNRIEGTLERIPLDKSVPLNDPLAFVPHWFSDGTSTFLKEERVNKVDVRLSDVREWRSDGTGAGTYNVHLPTGQLKEKFLPSSNRKKHAQTSDRALSELNQAVGVAKNHVPPSLSISPRHLNSAAIHSETEDDSDQPASSEKASQIADSSIASSNESSPSRKRRHTKKPAALSEETSDDNQFSTSPKRKRTSSVQEQEGRRLVPQLLQTLVEQSNQLRLNGEETAEHCEALDQCLKRILDYHQILSTDEVASNSSRGELFRNICSRLFSKRDDE